MGKVYRIELPPSAVEWAITPPEHEMSIPPPNHRLVQRYEFSEGVTLRSGDELELSLDGKQRIIGHRVIRARRFGPGRRVGRVAALAHRVR